MTRADEDVATPRVQEVAELDEAALSEAGVREAAALAHDDETNIHAALAARRWLCA
ncbi:hypothetical protein OG800_01850 [Streptomyces sp. NBC_00445]|uniref:hypothetical protein n=1 Tax=unclassified Streptomyces TaxID=2593676 RepID=UPI002E1AA3B4|nr:MULTISPECIES: hypothetical protein [unclassified Streptomyces]